jgi:hypothetical protein
MSWLAVAWIMAAAAGTIFLLGAYVFCCRQRKEPIGTVRALRTHRAGSTFPAELAPFRACPNSRPRGWGRFRALQSWRAQHDLVEGTHKASPALESIVSGVGDADRDAMA